LAFVKVSLSELNSFFIILLLASVVVKKTFFEISRQSPRPLGSGLETETLALNS